MGKEAAVEEFKKIISQINVNDSGFIHYSEFITACSAIEELLSKENNDSAFRIFGADCSGKITVSVLKEQLSTGNNVKKEAWDGLIWEVDQNGVGRLIWRCSKYD